MQHQLGDLSMRAASVVVVLLLLLLLLGVGVDEVDGYYGYGAFLGAPMPDSADVLDPKCYDEFKSCSSWAKKGLCCQQFYFDRCQLSCTTCGPGPQACNISGRIYPSGTKFQKNCMSFHCDAGELYTDNKYNPECGACLIQNDPHFLTYHNKKFDWHGNEMYALSQRGNDDCPTEYVNAQFSKCIEGLNWATCLDTIYFQPQPDTKISIVKADNIHNSLVTVNGVTNTITVQEDGKLHILDGAVDSEYPVLAWLNEDCLHFMGSKDNGFMIKLCSWSLKIFAYPELSNNLGGLCGNWDKDSVRYSEGSPNVWEEDICGADLLRETGLTLDACKDMCDESYGLFAEPCNAILYKPNQCRLLGCPLPVPDPTVSNLEYLGYVKGGIDQLRLRDGTVVIPPKADKLFINWNNMNINESFGHDWQVSCDRMVRSAPAVIDPNPCDLDTVALGAIKQICEVAVNEMVTEGLSNLKIAAIKADCSFDRCIAIKAANDTLAEEWLVEIKIQVQREVSEIKNTLENIHDPCFVGIKEYSSGTKWEDNCMSFYCEKGIFYTTNKYNSHCSACTSKNDPHFETFDGVIYDWHGHSTYILSQEGPEDCPDTFISSMFQPCAVGFWGATCLHTVYIQLSKHVAIEVKVENNMLDAEIIAGGFAQRIATESENEIQLLHDEFVNEERAVFGWMKNDCLHIIGFKKRGYLIKICKWSVKVFAHPSKSNNLYGLCGDNNGDTSHDLRLRNGDSINPPGRCFFCFANMNVDPKFGRDWEIKDCEVIANFTAGPIVDPVNLCDADEATLKVYTAKCEDSLKFGDHLSNTTKEKILADCAFDQCISASANNETLANEWLTECQVIVTTQEEEIVNTVQVPLICDPPCTNEGTCIGSTDTCKCKPGFTGVQCEDKDPDSCSLGGKLYKSGVEWQENCMMFYCKKGKFYTSEKFNGNCGICQVNNDPHFVTYDGATYDWHGHSTYLLSQRGDELCPEVAVSGKFKECGITFPFATCVDTIYFQLDKETNIKIVKHTAIFGKVSFTAHVNEYENNLKDDLDEGEMQPLRDEEKEYPVLAWNYDNCIQIMGFESKGFMIKLCSWSFKIYAHPSLSSNLVGLCGDFNNDQNEDLKMRNGVIISPPSGWPNKNVDAGFGDDWQVQTCEGEDEVRTPPGIGNSQNEAEPCEATEDVLQGYTNDCQDIIDKGKGLLSDAAKQRFIDGCVFDRCLAFRLADITKDTDIVGKWMIELQIMFEQEEEEIAKTVEYPLGSGKCPGGYMEVASQCLSINTDYDLLLNWEDARIHCESKSGRLAVIQKPEELQLFLNENQNGLRFWVGSSDLKEEGVWLWLSGDAVLGRPKFPWGPFEPNNLLFNEHCLEYNGQLHFYNDAACSDTINFICEANTVAQEKGSCIIYEKTYPNGQKWTDGCMTYYCKDGDFYTDNKYHGECGSCTAKNDPHFTTFDGTRYDWHGQSTYTVAQEGSSDCPEIFVQSKFSPCAVGWPGATCLHTIHFQPEKNTLITIIKGNSIEESEIYVDDYFQQINVIEEGQLQVIKGPNNKLKPAFMWISGGCLHIMAFDRQGLMIKLCDWSLKVFAHPVAANKLHGLCGDWNGNKVGDLKMRNGAIINPPGGFWASKNVDAAFGNDWEIVGSCTETADVELPTDPHTNTDGCDVTEADQTQFYEICQMEMEVIKDALDDNKLLQLIESCAFDLCIAHQTGNETITNIWINATLLHAQQEVDEITNTIKAKVPGSCYLDGTEYPQGSEWVENCMMYYCKNGKFYSSNSYNGDCGYCDSNNDPHFKTFDGVTYDWHGHSTYVVSQHGSEDCPDTYVNSQFTKCASGLPHATCVNIVYIQPLKGTLIKVVKNTDITQSEIHIDGYSQKVSVTGDGEMQILRGPDDQEKPAFAWFFNGCLHIQGFKVEGYLVKICHWSMKVFAHPVLANNLYGLCGDWNRNKVGDLKLRDGVTIIAPPAGGWWGKNVNIAFGEDWEIKTCTENSDITIGGEAITENPCEASEAERNAYHEVCLNEMTQANNGLNENKLQLLIEDCAFDRCIASQSDDATLIEVWINAALGILEEEIMEQLNTGLGSGSCYIGGVGYPSGREWQENCMRYYCEEGHFYSRKVYNSECGHCSSRNDPHFETYDKVKFDWHGHSTYVISQQSSADCPNAFVNSKFTNCAFPGIPGATCLDIVYYKIENSPVLKIVKDGWNVQNSKIDIDGNVQQLTTNNDGELQILKGPNNKEYPLLGLIHDGCIHIIGFDDSGYLIKLCHWELTIYSHPLIRDNLYGLCGDWDNSKNGDLKLRNGDIIQAPSSGGGGIFVFFTIVNKNVDTRYGNDWEVKECPTFIVVPAETEEIPENSCDASEDDLKEYKEACNEEVSKNKILLDEETINNIIEDCIFDRCIAKKSDNETLEDMWIKNTGGIVEQKGKEKENTIVPGSCLMSGEIYPSGTEWTDNCMTYYCEQGKFHSSNKYNGDCGSCSLANDPHFTSFDGVTFDWHGHSTYVISQHYGQTCPDVFVNSKFGDCAVGHPDATCLDTIYFQPAVDTLIKIVKDNHIQNSKIYVNGHPQKIYVKNNGELQILKGANNTKHPAFGWINNDCIYFTGFDISGYMIKICHWSLKIYVHPSQKNKLYGLCGDWNNNKDGDLRLRNGDKITAPGGGFFASQNVKSEFGNDWQVKGDCSTNTDNVISEAEVKEMPCTATEDKQEEYLRACSHKLKPLQKGLDAEKINRIIGECAFDRCIAIQTGNEKLPETWLTECGTRVEQEEEEIKNTVDSGKCYIDGVAYMNEQEWVDGCISYYCNNGKFYSHNQYNRDCGHCSAKNDPHFTTYDGTTYDWHGHNTYVISQKGSDNCPKEYVNGKFKSCTTGHRGATCIDEIYFQLMGKYEIKIVKAGQLKFSEVYVNGYKQVIAIKPKGELQVLKGPQNQEVPIFGWFLGNCIHIIGFDTEGFMIKICDWYVNVYAHPHLASNLYGLCGDWDGKRSGDLKLRDHTIVNPPGGWWATKNVEQRFGVDWEIKTNCPSTYRIIEEDDDNIGTACDAPKIDLDRYYADCKAKVEGPHNRLSKILLDPIIEDCAFDRCIAESVEPEAEKLKLIKLWMRKWGDVALQVQEEVDNTAGGTCADGFVQVGIQCFYFGTRDNDEAQLTWHNAFHRCQEKNGQLAVIKEPEVFKDLLKETFGNTYDFWIGMSDIEVEGQFQWIDGSPMAKDFKWNRGQPGNRHGDEDCVRIFSRGFDNDLKCTSVNNFVCEDTKGKATLPEPASFSTVQRIADEFIHWESGGGGLFGFCLPFIGCPRTQHDHDYILFTAEGNHEKNKQLVYIDKKLYTSDPEPLNFKLCDLYRGAYDLGDGRSGLVYILPDERKALPSLELFKIWQKTDETLADASLSRNTAHETTSITPHKNMKKVQC